MRHRTGRLRVLRGGKSLFHLRQDLWFADDHAVQAGSHAEQVPYGIHVGVMEHVSGDIPIVQAVEVGQETDELLAGRAARRFGRGRVQLDAIARRQQDDLRFRVGGAQRSEGFQRLGGCEGQTLSDINR